MFLFLLFQVDVKMMYKEDRFHVYYDHEVNTSVLHLPFNSSHAMLLMLPDDMNTLERAICPHHVTKWLKWMKQRFETKKCLKFSACFFIEITVLTVVFILFFFFFKKKDIQGVYSKVLY